MGATERTPPIPDGRLTNPEVHYEYRMDAHAHGLEVTIPVPPYTEPQPEQAFDKVDPNHYNLSVIEPIDFIEANCLPFWAGSVIKYVCRAGKKPGETVVDDLRKAIRYIEMHINHLQGRPAHEDT